MGGGKSRKGGSISKKLIDRIKSGKAGKNAQKKASESKGLDLGDKK
jgi:hypothetical protein